MLKPKGGSSGTANKVYHKFYTSEGTTQYFISPLEFNSKKSSCVIDFTLKDDFKDYDSVTVNITILSLETIKDFATSSFKVNEENYSVLSHKRLFIEKNKDTYNTRYTSKILFKDFVKISQNNHTIVFICDNVDYQISKKSKKALDKINEEITEIIILNSKD